MNQLRPSVEKLRRRLARCPPEYLAEPKIGDEPGVHVDAVVADLLVRLGGGLRRYDELEAFRTNMHHHRDYHRLVLVACWLLGDEVFGGRRAEGEEEVAGRAERWLRDELEELAGVVEADEFVTDPERREELARRAIFALDMIPGGESPEEARDRLTMIDSVERHRLVLETQERVRRAEELRRKMARKKAREAAARYTRE